MKIYWKIFIAILFVSALSVSAQDNAQIEKELTAALKQIQAHSIYGGDYSEEKLTAAQKDFEQKLVRFTKVSSTLGYTFNELDDQMSIVTSDDQKLRVYSWDLEDGGTMHRFARLYQFRSADGRVLSKIEEIPAEGMGRGFVTDIFNLDTTRGTVYIVCSTFIGSTKDYFQSADLFQIAGSTLNEKVYLIRTRSRLTNSLSFAYDNFSVIDRPDRPDRLIFFDKKTKTLSIPVVIKDKEFPDGRVTDKFIRYRFNGRYFVRL